MMKMAGLMIKDHEKQLRRSMRAVKTMFFLITMLFSLLLFSAPVLLVIADAILPSAILSASLPPSSDHLSLENLSSHLTNYDFRFSLIDIPLLSIVRSSVILCVYCLCDGPRLSRGPYLGITTFCSLVSLVFVSLKASYVFCSSSSSSNINIEGQDGFRHARKDFQPTTRFYNNCGGALKDRRLFTFALRGHHWQQNKMLAARIDILGIFPSVTIN
ncbi:MENTAL domain [Macleaya cordata]|uniref:MENTAL domain n=1 Tax=Macleaya cordata TaxID=56857 RepID=A0A200PWU5_MACCD|nr:MENTAL domain [Macleaya cordata]